MILPLRTPGDAELAAPAVAEQLAGHRLLAYPTETVYGLGSAAEPRSLARLAALKGRQRGKPFLLLVANRRMAEASGLVFTPAADALAEAFWPGPLTLVLRGGEGKLPDGLRGPEGGIAVRHTSNAAVARLIALLDQPLTSTSANIPGQPPAPGAEQIVALFRSAYDAGDLLVLDGGTLGNVPPSTMVDCTGYQPALIREGALPRQELRAAVGRLAP
ncbi:MAG TPA: L-threonylcarbamoyladenylate synthase [Gemmatimonadales bacterium]|jgi:L-threonylcarbamoyladenylate synthase|nr:L-threonylcarbamoyladenylate synthase [Gemmatimonadales bacterium]